MNNTAFTTMTLKNKGSTRFLKLNSHLLILELSNWKMKLTSIEDFSSSHFSSFLKCARKLAHSLSVKTGRACTRNSFFLLFLPELEIQVFYSCWNVGVVVQSHGDLLLLFDRIQLICVPFGIFSREDYSSKRLICFSFKSGSEIE